MGRGAGVTVHPARALAEKYILERIKPGESVLDLCCGDGWLTEQLRARGCQVVAVDRDLGRLRRIAGDYVRVFDLGARVWDFTEDRFDVVVSVYGIQHMLRRECVAWGQFYDILKPEGTVIMVGRHQYGVPQREIGRADPLNPSNLVTLTAMGLASGLQVLDFETFGYDAEKGWWPEHPRQANAFCATLMREAA